MSSRFKGVTVLILAVVVQGCGPGTSSTTVAMSESIMTSAAPTTSLAPTTTTSVEITTTSTTLATTTTTVATTTTTETLDATSGCPDCPEWATDEDIEYVSAMRLISSGESNKPNYVSRLSDFEVIDMGQTICIGLDGSYNGEFDLALEAQMIIYDIPPGAGAGMAVSAMEQAVRIYCPEYAQAWRQWAGRDPSDPFV